MILIASHLPYDRYRYHVRYEPRLLILHRSRVYSSRTGKGSTACALGKDIHYDDVIIVRHTGLRFGPKDAIKVVDDERRRRSEPQNSRMTRSARLIPSLKGHKKMRASHLFVKEP